MVLFRKLSKVFKILTRNHWDIHQTKCKKYEPKKPPVIIKKVPLRIKPKPVEEDDDDELPDLIPIVDPPKVKREVAQAKSQKKKAEVKKAPMIKKEVAPVGTVNEENLEQWRADFEAQIEMIQSKGHA
jgi:hypothetical protein